MAAVLLRVASLAFVMVLGILLKKTGIVGNPAMVLRRDSLFVTLNTSHKKAIRLPFLPQSQAFRPLSELPARPKRILRQCHR